MRFIKTLFRHFKLISIATIVAIVVVLGGWLLSKYLSPNLPVQSNPAASSNLVSPNPTSSSPSLATPAAPTDATDATNKPDPTQQPHVSGKPYLGHFPYPEADRSRLMIITSYAKGEYQRFESMDIEAGKALMKLIYAARDEGVWIIPVSGFRSVEQQSKLFKAQIERRGSEQEAAKLSAPPGYSEHATGYAVDLTDGKFPKQDVKFEFEQTDAFRWLTLHAKEYGFEMSFPQGNAQGVSYEPWHWRFVGSSSAAQLFGRSTN